MTFDKYADCKACGEPRTEESHVVTKFEAEAYEHLKSDAKEENKSFSRPALWQCAQNLAWGPKENHKERRAACLLEADDNDAVGRGSRSTSRSSNGSGYDRRNRDWWARSRSRGGTEDRPNYESERPDQGEEARGDLTRISEGDERSRSNRGAPEGDDLERQRFGDEVPPVGESTEPAAPEPMEVSKGDDASAVVPEEE